MISSNENIQLVLGSTSPFRREILTKLGLPFQAAVPDIDESAQTGESPEALVCRLAELKARAVAEQHPQGLIIGSDQVASVDGEILGKPGNRDNAVQQLLKTSGKVVTFYTGLCLLNAEKNRLQVVCEPFKVHFRELNQEQIERYIDKEQPLNCEGSFKSEALGITLFSKLEGDDPNSLIGLPLIQLVSMLGNEGIELP